MQHAHGRHAQRRLEATRRERTSALLAWRRRAPGGWTEDDVVQRFAHAVGTPPELIRNKIRDL